MNEIQDLLLNLIKTSIKAGNSILTFYDNPKFTIKDDKSPLTEADLASNAIIKNDLMSYSKLPILSEEESVIDWDERSKWAEFWLVDPLDGTKEFLKKNGEFTVNIALIRHNKPVMGVIYAPALKTLYYASKGLGSYKHLNVFNHEDINFLNKNNLITTKNTLDNLKIVASRSHPSELLEKWLKNQNHYKLIDSGSSLKFCLVAEGVADVYPRFVGSSEWDIAAGHIILTEAKGVILDENNNELLFNKKSIRNPFFIASSSVFSND
jgi:3'(2'), 5'-bisphosphate nucleotidase